MTGIHACALLAGVLAALGVHAELATLPSWTLWLGAASLPLFGIARLRPLATLGVGFLWAWWPLRDYDRAVLPPAFDERVLVIAGLEGLPQRRGADEYFTATIRPLHAGVLPAPVARAVLRWHDAPPLQRRRALATAGAAARAERGVESRLRRAGRAVAAVARARQRAGARHRRSTSGSQAPARSLDGLRERIAAAIGARVVERDAAALMIALAVGDTQRDFARAMACLQCRRASPTWSRSRACTSRCSASCAPRWPVCCGIAARRCNGGCRATAAAR